MYLRCPSQSYGRNHSWKIALKVIPYWREQTTAIIIVLHFNPCSSYPVIFVDSYLGSNACTSHPNFSSADFSNKNSSSPTLDKQEMEICMRKATNKQPIVMEWSCTYPKEYTKQGDAMSYCRSTQTSHPPSPSGPMCIWLKQPRVKVATKLEPKWRNHDKNQLAKDVDHLFHLNYLK